MGPMSSKLSTFQDIGLNEMILGRRGERIGGIGGSKDRNVIVNLGAVPLGDTLCNPDDVPALLLLQLDVGIENTEVELVEESQLVELHLQDRKKKDTIQEGTDEYTSTTVLIMTRTRDLYRKS